MPGVDRSAPLRFLRTAYQPDDWVAVFLKSYETGRVVQRVGPLSMVVTPRYQAWLRSQNARRYNVYIGVNGIAPGRRSRTREAIGAIRHVFLEADHDGPRVLATLAGRRDLPPPSYVLHSSPNRVHVFWRVSGFTTEFVETLQKYLARELGTDPAATPASQTTRLPGFFNHKYTPPHLLTIEYGSTEQIYGPTDFPVPGPAINLVPSPPGGRRPSKSRPIERARMYLALLPPAIAGQHGDVHTFRVCCRLVRGFVLSDDEALTLLTDWNARCQPPWAERDLIDKLARARRYGREPIGGLLEDRR